MHKFYTLWRENGELVHKEISGTPVDNHFGLELSAYHSSETYDSGDKRWWYVVEESVGLAIGRGHTKAEAINNALCAISSRGIENVRADIEKHIEIYGLTPDHCSVG